MLFLHPKRKVKHELFCYELGLGVCMKVVEMNVSFHLSLVGLHLDSYNLRYDQNTTHGSAGSCSFPRLSKINFSKTFYFELSLDVFT